MLRIGQGSPSPENGSFHFYFLEPQNTLSSILSVGIVVDVLLAKEQNRHFDKFQIQVLKFPKPLPSF